MSGGPTKVRRAGGIELESWTTTEYSDFNRGVIVRYRFETIGNGKKGAVQR